MERKVIFTASVHVKDGNILNGEITTTDDKQYMFQNKPVDYWVILEKRNDTWLKVGGMISDVPREQIEELGFQIDKFLIENPILQQHPLGSK